MISTVTGASAALIVALVYDQTGSYVYTFTVWGICCIIAGVGFLFSKPRPIPASVQSVS